jgi:hypothetical protein
MFDLSKRRKVHASLIAADKESVSSATSYTLQSCLTTAATTRAAMEATTTAVKAAPTTLEGTAMGCAGDLAVEVGLSMSISSSVTAARSHSQTRLTPGQWSATASQILSRRLLSLVVLMSVPSQVQTPGFTSIGMNGMQFRAPQIFPLPPGNIDLEFFAKMFRRPNGRGAAIDARKSVFAPQLPARSIKLAERGYFPSTLLRSHLSAARGYQPALLG